MVIGYWLTWPPSQWKGHMILVLFSSANALQITGGGEVAWLWSTTSEQHSTMFCSILIWSLAPHFAHSRFYTCKKIIWMQLKPNNSAKLAKNLIINIKPYFIYTSAGHVTDLTINYKTTKMSPYLLNNERKVVLFLFAYLPFQNVLSSEASGGLYCSFCIQKCKYKQTFER